MIENIEVCRGEPAFKDLHHLIHAGSKVRVTFKSASGVKSKLRAPRVLVTIALAKTFMVRAVKLLGFSLHFDVI